MDEAQGWYQDPWGRHQDRYYSAGEATSLVRDDGVDGHDDPPAGGPDATLVPAETEEPSDGRDLLRADATGDPGDGTPGLAAMDAATTVISAD